MQIQDTLYDISPGQQAVIKDINTENSIKRRLLDIGLIKDTVVECVGKSPLGDPKAYLIRGAVIALRSEESSRIYIAYS